MKDCYVWLYRGAWNEWKVYDIEMAVPLSPEQVLKKEELFLNINHKKMVQFFLEMMSESSGKEQRKEIVIPQNCFQILVLQNMVPLRVLRDIIFKINLLHRNKTLI